MSDFVHGDSEREVHREKDIEAADLSGLSDAPPYQKGEFLSDEQILARELQQKKGFLRRLRRGEEWLDEKMGIETQGIDRIKEEDKKPPSIWNVFFLWWSLTCHVGTLPIGFVGPQLGLSLGQSVAAIVTGTILGALCTAYTGTLGPKVRIIIVQLEYRFRTNDLSSAYVLLLPLDTLSVTTGPSFAQSSILSLVVVSQSSMWSSLVRFSRLSQTTP